MTVTPNIQSIVTVVENKADEANMSSSSVVSWCSDNWKAILGEAVSTTLLVFFGCMSCIPIDGYNPQPAMYAPLAFGMIVMFNIQTFAHISGAHMNPCITLLAIFCGKISVGLGLAYSIAQCIGSIFGYWVLSRVSPVNMAAEAICVTLPHARLDNWQVLIVEALLTGALCLMTCAIWDPVYEKYLDSVPIKFGLVISGLSFAGGPLTGASMNPARSLGPALIAGVWTVHWAYWVGPFMGTILAGSLYMFAWFNRKPKDAPMNVNT